MPFDSLSRWIQIQIWYVFVWLICFQDVLLPSEHHLILTSCSLGTAAADQLYVHNYTASSTISNERNAGGKARNCAPAYDWLWQYVVLCPSRFQAGHTLGLLLLSWLSDLQPSRLSDIEPENIYSSMMSMYQLYASVLHFKWDVDVGVEVEYSIT